MLRLTSVTGLAVLVLLPACELVTDFSHDRPVSEVGGGAGDDGKLGNDSGGAVGGTTLNPAKGGKASSGGTSGKGSTTSTKNGTSIIASGGSVVTEPSTTGGASGVSTVSSGGTSTSAGGTIGTGATTALTCTGTQQACSGTCVDVQTDAVNCGRCSHSCLGGECKSGECQPTNVTVTTYSVPTVVAYDKTYLYFDVPGMGYSTSFYRVNKTAVAGVGDLLASEQITSFALASDRLYWHVNRSLMSSNTSECTIRSCQLETCASNSADWLTSTSQVIASTTIAASHISTVDWACALGWCVTWWGSDGLKYGAFSDYYTGPVDDVVSYSRPNAYGDNVYWVQSISAANGTFKSAGLFVTSAATPSRGQLAKLSSSTYILSVNEASVLLLDVNTKQVYRVPLPLGLGNNQPTPLGIVASTATEDAAGLYWIDDNGTLSTCQVANCAATTRILAIGQTEPRGLIRDEVALYWGRSTPNQIMRLAK